jgi:hypothetical protein
MKQNQVILSSGGTIDGKSSIVHILGSCLVLALTVFFGVIQGVEGALQVYVAYWQASGFVASGS